MLKLLLVSMFFLNNDLVRKEISNHPNDNHQVQTVVSSWYGGQFHGKPMANGERFDKRQLIVAHRQLPFGTVVILTNPTNGRSVKAIIKDRGPFIENRQLDVSEKVAEELGFKDKGVTTLVMEVKQKEIGK